MFPGPDQATHSGGGVEMVETASHSHLLQGPCRSHMVALAELTLSMKLKG